MSREREQKESEAGKQKNLEAFGRYCKGGKQVIYDRVPAKEELSIFVRIEKKFMGDEIEWGAHSYDEYFNAMSDLCKKTGIVYMEGMYSSYNKAKKGFDIEFRRHPICARAGEEWVVGSEIQSRYELVLGQTGRKDPAPWRGSLASSSIQIMDRQTGRVLAEDDMYFLSGHPSGADCPWGGGQLSELLVKVFGRSPLEVN
ncbi:hypothetical protein GCM10007907_08760 [Chitinimonas prasina]|uniref:Uncharacterized protein n=2 Tax=Chitinimonas prasina TaxID=1434937 RepID=A0ABQ5YC07_9NEIS|nr:hypothetical protein GCM10007907_08760 [Chitinimonas prasina]